MGCAQASDRVNHQQGVRQHAHQFRNRLDIMARARGTFGCLHINAADLGHELAAHFLERKCFAIRSRHGLDGAAKCLGQRGPALGEFAGGEHQNTVAG